MRLAVILLAATAPARADELVLGKDEVALAMTVEASNGQASLAPDAWFGVSSRWTVGITSSSAAIDRIGSGGGMCLSSCTASYAAGLEVRWGGHVGALAIAPRVRLLAREVDPVRGFAMAEPAATVGALVRWTRGPFAIMSDPYLRVGLAARQMNADALVLPVWLAVQPAARWSLAVHVGWGGNLPVAPNTWHIPLALDVHLHATAALEVGLEAGFTSFAGPEDARVQRAVSVGISWHQR